MHHLPNETLLGFENKLRSSSLSDKTIRNYLSDVSQFSSWMITLVGTNEFIPSLSSSIIEKYRDSMIINAVTPKTVNRRLSAIRLLGRYLCDNGLLSHNPAQNVANIKIQEENEYQHILEEFKKYLEKQSISPKTIRNYISDVRGFLSFVEIKTRG